MLASSGCNGDLGAWTRTGVPPFRGLRRL